MEDRQKETVLGLGLTQTLLPKYFAIVTLPKHGSKIPIPFGYILMDVVFVNFKL